MLSRRTVAVGNELTVVEQSPSIVEVATLKNPCPLYCVCHPHGIDTHYQWSSIPEDERVFADAPVVYVNKCGCYICVRSKLAG